MRILLTRPRTALAASITAAALIATVLIRGQFAGPEQIMQSRGGYGIVPYELAFTARQADTILSAWGAEGQEAARRSLLVDFAFMPAYATLFAGITLLVARAARGQLQSVGLMLAPLQYVAALLDALENVMLLSLLGTQGAVPTLPPLAAGLAASIKFLILTLALIYWLAAGGAALLRLIQRPAA
ncbi:MAG: hypothetical protein Kow00124_12830 [Anaerolineae bacterium]